MITVISDVDVWMDGGWRRFGRILIREGRAFDGARAPAPECDEPARRLNGGHLTPAPFDLQVNGGGGYLLDHATTPEAVRAVCAAHTGLGTGRMLATIITASEDTREKAVQAVIACLNAGVRGLAGVHFEGPFINPIKAGIHAPRHILAAGRRELLAMADQISRVRQAGGRVLVTVAPEIVAPDGVCILKEAGAVLAAGHSNADHATAMAGFDAGISGVTHLYNAMSQLVGREPGLVGAALERDDVWCSLIADGVHCHPASAQIAAKCKPGGRLVLVSDAMPTVGGPERFIHDGASVTLRDGRLVDGEGRLAGAHLWMVEAIRRCHELGVVSLASALEMACVNPALAMGDLDGARGVRFGQACDMMWVTATGDRGALWLDDACHFFGN